MILIIFLFTILTILTDVSGGQNTKPICLDDNYSTTTRNDVDVDALFNVIDMPRCIWQCITNLRLEMTQLLLFNNTYDNFQRLCDESEKTKKCVHQGFCLSSKIFDSVTSGITSLCDGPKQQFIRKNEKCLRKNLDNVNHKCEKKCKLLNSIAEFSHKKDLKVHNIAEVFQLLSTMGGLCSSSDCFLQCFREELNNDCPRAGGVITDGLLRPFYQLANFFRKVGKGLRKIVKEKLPTECLFLTEKSSLDKIVNPNKQ